jgi:RNA polymerase sigma factor (sigma-70 family)
MLASKKVKDYFAMQKTRQVKKIKEDAIYKSVNIESFPLSSECTSDKIHTRIDNQRLLTNALTKLKPREERIIRMRFGIKCKEHTLQEVSNILNVCSERIRELEARSLRILKKKVSHIHSTPATLCTLYKGLKV